MQNTTPISKARQLGLDKAAQSFYWAHLFNEQMDRFETVQEKVDFWNGYHDGLADKYKFERTACLKVEEALADPGILHLHSRF